MIDVKQAVAAAMQAIKEYYEGLQKLPGLALEEVELSQDEKTWLITLGFYEEATVTKSFVEAMQPLTRPRFERKYKLFHVDAESGDVSSMKIRQV